MSFRLLTGDCLDVLATLEPESAQCCVTSPPYWGLRDYCVAGQLGLEKTPDEYVARMVEVFRGVRRALADDGTLWLNLGDSYAMTTKGAGGAGKQHTNTGAVMADRCWQLAEGLKPKDLVGIPWRVALALQADGWYLRSDIIWHKPNAMPESVTDRPTKAHEYLFLLAKSERYFYDAAAIQERSVTGDPRRPYTSAGAWALDGRPDEQRHSGEARRGDDFSVRNRRTVWTVATEPYDGAHFATFPPSLIVPCILAGSRPEDLVLDPFNGAGTTGLVALKHGRRYLGIELNPAYVAMSERRLRHTTLPLPFWTEPAEAAL